MDGPDHEASLEPHEFENLVEGIKNISLSLGSAEKKVSQSEIKNLYIARKSLVAKELKKVIYFLVKIYAPRDRVMVSPL